MRTLFISAMIVGVVCIGIMSARAAPQPIPGITATKAQAEPVEDVGYRRRYYRRYGYPMPYAYYPPAYGYYVPPPVYVYPPAYSYDAPSFANGDYPPPDDYDDYPPANGDYGDYPPENGY